MTLDSTTYTTLSVLTEGQVATISIYPHDEVAARRKETGRSGNRHLELAGVLEALRADDGIRVVVLTGSGEHFAFPATPEQYESRTAVDVVGTWQSIGSLVRCHQVMAEMEKPVIAKVNGHAVGFGQSIVFASDLIIAREDAIFMDHHMGGILNFTEGGQPKAAGHSFSSVPGDGGAALIPLFMSPVKAKEYLMLAQPYTAAELARMGVINYAVPADELDRKVDDIVQRLLQRAAYPLAWTKRIVNRTVAEQLNRTLDAGIAYEMVGFLHREKQGGQDKLTLG